MDVIYELTEEHIQQLHALYQHEWWTVGRTLEQTQQCVDGSQICLGLIDNHSQLQGFARVITDYTFKAFIFDLIIAKKHRHAGLGRRLLELIKSHDQLKHVHHIELYCKPDVETFYAQHGFTSDIEGIKLLRYLNSK